ncbi:MAG: AsmA family protein [Thiohalobacteraceae bacterium]
MRKSVRLGLSFLALAALGALAGPFVLDAETLRRALIDQLSTALGRPVTIERLQIKFLPAPSVRLATVKTAFADTAESHLAIDQIDLELAWSALLRGKFVIRQLDIDGVALNRVLTMHLRRLVDSPGNMTSSSEQAAPIRSVAITRLVWHKIDGSAIGPFVANLTWDSGLRPRRIDIAQYDDRLKLALDLRKDQIGFKVEAQDWVAPIGPRIPLTELRIDGRYDGTALEVTQGRILGPDGTLQFSGPIRWNPDWSIQSKLHGERLNLATLLPAFGQPSVPGLLQGDCRLSLNAERWDALLHAPGLDCDLTHAQGNDVSSLKLVTTPTPDGLSLNLNADNFSLPLGPALSFDTLHARGTLLDNRLNLRALHIEAYDGSLESHGLIDFGPLWKIRFDAKTLGVQLAPLLHAVRKRSLDGRLASDCTGSFEFDTRSAHPGRPDVRCDFEILDGKLYGADLEGAATLLKPGSSDPGSTPFDRLSGRLQLQRGVTQISEFRLQSAALEATGQLALDAQDALSGELSVGLKNTAGVVSVPLQVEGKLGAPEIRPTASAMAGGAAGTLLLGPGLGTAIGVKTGEALRKASGWLKKKGAEKGGDLEAGD